MEKQKRKRTEEDDALGGESKEQQLDAIIDQLSPHQSTYEQLEKYRIEKLVQFAREKEFYQMRNKELEALAEFMKSDETKSGFSATEKVNPVLDEILNSQNTENLIKLNVGGKIFTTTRSTIMKRDNMLKVMLNSEFKIDTDENGNILFADRNPDFFPIILEHLRTGSTTHIGIWQGTKYISKLRQLLDESEFFGTSKLSETIQAFIGEQEVQETATEEGTDKMVEDMIETKNNKMFDEQEKEDEEWINKFSKLTLQEKQTLERYFLETEKQLQMERDAISEKEKSLKLFDVTFNVRGVLFKVNVEKLLKHTNSLLIPIVKNISVSGQKEIFLDRDPTVYSVFFHYIETGNAIIPPEEFKKKQLYKEANLLNLKSFLEYFNPLRFPVELIGEENLAIKKEEDILRRMFATDRDSPVLNDPYLHLLPMFGKDGRLRTSFNIKEDIPKDIGTLFDFENPLEASDLSTSKNNLKIPKIPELIETREDFYTQFNAFTHGMMRNMDWSNLFVAGGSILATTLKNQSGLNKIQGTPLTLPKKKQESWAYDDGDVEIEKEEEKDITNSDDEYFSDRSDGDPFISDSDSDSSLEYEVDRSFSDIRNFDEKLANIYNSSVMWKDSDIDIFLYGLTPEQAEEKIIYLYNLFKKNLREVSPKLYSSVKNRTTDPFSVPYKCRNSFRRYIKESPQKEDNSDDIMIFRTEHAITFRFNNPVRAIQIITRIYKSPAEILIGFDIPSCAVGFDGHGVYCLPRTRKAFVTRCNIVDPERQSTTYETRLVKYALRGFRIGVAGHTSSKIVRKSLVSQDYRYYNIRSVCGLARILLMRSAFKFCDDSTRIFSRIQGVGSNLKKTEKAISEPSLDHDYVQVNFSAAKNTGLHFFNRSIEKKINHLTLEKILVTKPYFEYSLNDIDRIIKPSPNQQISDLPSRIAWITIEPNRQSIGSFHPSERNFLEDAYSKTKSMEKKYKYYWYWKKDNGEWQLYDKDVCIAIEKLFRNVCDESQADTSLKIDDLNMTFNFMCDTVHQNGKEYSTKREKQRSNPKFFKRIDEEPSHSSDSSDEE